MANYINSNELSFSLMDLLEVAQDSGYMTSDEIAAITAVVNENLYWQIVNLSGIENWLNLNEPTTTSTTTTSTTNTSTTTTTSGFTTSTSVPPTDPPGSNGSNSLLASSAMVAAVFVVFLGL